MKQDLKEKITKIYSLLSTEQKTEDIVRIEDNSENSQIIDYLESIGTEEFKYKVTYKKDPPVYIPRETRGDIYLWEKGLDGTWIIQLWQINRIIR